LPTINRSNGCYAPAREFALRIMHTRLALVVSAASAGHGSGLI
jgi:hypothetical protein